MTFLAPLMLFGSAAVGIPIALHFFYKARHRPLPWAAMEFLRQSIEQTSRRLRFQELVLLILRCLVLALLALALARLSCQWGGASGRGESVDAILVFDTSYSMGARMGDKTRLQRAQEAALSVIDNLPDRSTVQVITCSDRAATVRFTPTNLDQARQEVRSLELTSLAGGMLPGLAEAQAAFERGVGNKEVYIFSDMQKNGWERQSAAVKVKAQEIRDRGSPLILVRCGDPAQPVANVAVTDITIPIGIPHSGTRLPFTVLLKNTGKVPVANVAVSLEVDGEKQEIDTAFAAVVEPGATVPVNLTGKLAKAGARLLTARIGQRTGTESTASPPDDLPGDNRFDKLIAVRETIRVLLVDGAPDSGDATKSATFFVRNALLPTTETARENWYLKVTEVRPDALSPALLGDADICVLANVPSADSDRPGIPGLPKDFLDRLPEFVRAGGGLVIGGGDSVFPERYNAVLGPLGLLPFPLEEATSAPIDKPYHPAPDSTDANSFLRQFRESSLSLITGQVNVSKALGSNESDKAGGGRVLMRFDTNSPFITSRTLGEGEILFISTSLDYGWTDWAGHLGGGSFIAVIYKAVAHFTERSAGTGNKVAGQPLQWSPPTAGKNFEVVRPDRSRVGIGPAVGGDKGRFNVSFGDTFTAGEYQFGIEGESVPSGPRFAVAPDLRESENLDALTDDEFETAVGFKPVIVEAWHEGNTLGDLRSRRELTVWLLLLVFAFAGIETLWAWHCGRAK